MSNGLHGEWNWASAEIPGSSASGHRLQGAVAILDRRLPFPDRIMPVPSRQLKVQAITDRHVWLTGAAPEFLRAIAELPNSA